ncbi:hypothetical protein FB451DRAFT_1467571 [Mycena latifolia]|nr:hypothetical protein FB451DRAFT_1467571 [Mycena latifolia]
MKFSTAAILATVVLPLGALAGLTAPQVVTNIQIVTSISGSTNSAVGKLTPTTSPSQIKTIGATVATNLNTIITNLGGDVTAMQATTAFGDADAQTVVDALRTFVEVHQALLSTIIGKHSILAQFGVTAPIAAALRSLEAAIDSFAFAMINLIPTQAPAVTNDQNSLDGSVTNTITIYEQICIPSILYPTLPPVCASV